MNKTVCLGSRGKTIFGRIVLLLVLLGGADMMSYVNLSFAQIGFAVLIAGFSFWASLRYVYGVVRDDGIYYRRFFLNSRLGWENVRHVAVDKTAGVIVVTHSLNSLFGEKLFFRTPYYLLEDQLKGNDSAAAAKLRERLPDDCLA